MEDLFHRILSPYTSPTYTGTLWREIEINYTSLNRFYHNLEHLHKLLDILQGWKEDIQDWESMVLAVYYHDAIYDVSRQDNEEQSAALAVERLSATSFPKEKIALCKAHILATKSHSVSENEDTNLFTDADLSILGAEWRIYEDYTRKIRKEYSIYPDEAYKPGRSKVMEHFLQMDHIFKTEKMRAMYEQQARENIRQELKLLQA